MPAGTVELCLSSTLSLFSLGVGSSLGTAAPVSTRAFVEGKLLADRSDLLPKLPPRVPQQGHALDALGPAKMRAQQYLLRAERV